MNSLPVVYPFHKLCLMTFAATRCNQDVYPYRGTTVTSLKWTMEVSRLSSWKLQKPRYLCQVFAPFLRLDRFFSFYAPCMKKGEFWSGTPRGLGKEASKLMHRSYIMRYWGLFLVHSLGSGFGKEKIGWRFFGATAQDNKQSKAAPNPEKIVAFNSGFIFFPHEFLGKMWISPFFEDSWGVKRHHLFQVTYHPFFGGTEFWMNFGTWEARFPCSLKVFSSELTPPKTNIAPENRPSQKETSIPTIHFYVLC